MKRLLAVFMMMSHQSWAEPLEQRSCRPAPPPEPMISQQPAPVPILAATPDDDAPDGVCVMSFEQLAAMRKSDERTRQTAIDFELNQ